MAGHADDIPKFELILTSPITTYNWLHLDDRGGVTYLSYQMP